MEVSDTSLIIRDRCGKPRITLSANDKVPSISLIGDDRSELLLEAADGYCRIRFRDRSGADVALVSASTEGAGVSVFDVDSRAVARIEFNRMSRMINICSVGSDGEVTNRASMTAE